MARNGKIARLSAAVRQELNRRLHEGERARRLVVWLNELPEVRAVLAREFGGKGINEPNLCAWRSGGYRDWLATREVRSQAETLAADAGELNEAVTGGLTEHLATAVTARYGVALAKWNGEVTEEFRGKVQVLRRLCRDVVGLRRGEYIEARLKLERERLGLKQRE